MQLLIQHKGSFGKVYSGSMEIGGRRVVVAIKTMKSKNTKHT